MFASLLGALSAVGSIFSTIGKVLGLVQRQQDIQTGEYRQALTDEIQQVARDAEARSIDSTVAGMSRDQLDSQLRSTKSGS